jgi:hypothetical protein
VDLQDDIGKWDLTFGLPLVSDPRGNDKDITCTRDLILCVSDCGPSPLSFICKLFLQQPHTSLQDCTTAAYEDDIAPVIM